MNNKTNAKRIVTTFIGMLALGGLIFAGITADTQAQIEVRNEKSAAQNTGCSNETISGKYAVVGSGFVPDGAPTAPKVPFAIMSLMTLDGTGGLTNKVTVNRNGQIQQNLDSGTYAVNNDCTGTITIAIPTAPFQLTFNLVVANMQGNQATEFYFIGTTASVVTHAAKRIQ